MPGTNSKQGKNRSGSPATPLNMPGFLSVHPLFSEWLIALVAVIFYANSLGNQFALDDGLVLRDNKLVLDGIQGIPAIFSYDSFYGSIGTADNLTGGRYRPLSLATFALEISLFGKNPFIHHLINVLLYAFSCLVLCRLLTRYILKEKTAALVATLLFAIHPIHTEVVANIKSRDEILSLLFLMLCLHYLFKYLQGSPSSLFISMGFYLLALFSKENGLIFVIMIPLSLWTFSRDRFSLVLVKSIPFWIMAGVYVSIRMVVIGWSSNEVPEVMDNPYLLAGTGQKFATVTFVWLRYVQLMLLPYPMTYDYSFNQIPYREWSDPLVMVSFLIHLVAVSYGFYKVGSRSVLSWCIAFYLGGLLLVSNLFFNIGAPMAERFLYQASFPFLTALVVGIHALSGILQIRMPVFKSVTTALIIALIPVCAWLTMQRNRDWYSDETLFLTDVHKSSHSARALTYAGIAWIRKSDAVNEPSLKKEYALQSLPYFEKSEQIKQDYLPTLLNHGVAYSRLDSADRAEAIWNRARNISPENKTLETYSVYLFQSYYRRGLLRGADGDVKGALDDLLKAVAYDPQHADAWYNLGGAYFTSGDLQNARISWEKCLLLKPDHAQAAAGIVALGKTTP